MILKHKWRSPTGIHKCFHMCIKVSLGRAKDCPTTTVHTALEAILEDSIYFRIGFSSLAGKEDCGQQVSKAPLHAWDSPYSPLDPSPQLFPPSGRNFKNICLTRLMLMVKGLPTFMEGVSGLKHKFQGMLNCETIFFFPFCPYKTILLLINHPWICHFPAKQVYT